MLMEISIIKNCPSTCFFVFAVLNTVHAAIKKTKVGPCYKSITVKGILDLSSTDVYTIKQTHAGERYHWP